MLASLDPTNPPLVRLLCVLDACENGLRFYELGTSAPQLAREVADALAAFRLERAAFSEAAKQYGAVLLSGRMVEPSAAMIDAGVRVLEATGEVDADELVRAILVAAAGASIDDENRRRQAETTRPQG